MTDAERPRANREFPRSLLLVPSDYKTSEQYTVLRDEIEAIFGYVYEAQNIEDCERFIRDKHGNPQYEQIFFIVHIDLSQEILERDIHDIRVIESIFIFNPTQCSAHFPFEKYSNIHTKIFTDTNDLLLEISNEVSLFSIQSYIPLPTLKRCHLEQTTNIVNNIADYSELWYPLFIDLLFDMPSSTDPDGREHWDHFVDQCRLFYTHNDGKLQEIENFITPPAKSYKPNCAILYYTRNSFLYRLVNKELRQQNIEAIFDFQFLLYDIHVLLQDAYKQFSTYYEIGDTMTFYRGQLLLKREMDILQEKRRDGSLITVNSYLSTSIMQEVALTFIKNKSNALLVPVLLEINAEFKICDKTYRKPFAYIGHLSTFGCGECEVLFSIGSFFRIDHIEFNDHEQIWIVKMTFIFDEDHLTVTNDYKSLKTCIIEEKIIKVGTLLSHHKDHSKTGQVHKFYQHFLTKNYGSSITASCYIGLAWFALQQQDYDLTIQHIEQALDICKLLPNSSTLNYLQVMSYCCLGSVYRQMKDNQNALEFYTKAYNIDRKIIPIDKYAFYNLFNQIASINIASIYKLTDCVDRAWTMFKDILTNETGTSNHFHSAIYLTISEAGLSDFINLKSFNERKKWSDDWKTFFELSFQELSGNYRQCVVSSALSMGFKFSTDSRTYDNAIICFEKVIQISKQFFKKSSDYYNNMIQCYQQLARIYRLKHKYTLAIEYASEILNICRINDLQAVNDCYTILVKIYEEQFQELNSTPSPDVISLKLCASSSSSLSPFYFGIQESLLFQFDRDEFSFGEFKKGLNSNLVHEERIEHRLAYCCFKLAALNHEQNNFIKARELLDRAFELLPNDRNVEFVYETNKNYLEGTYDRIIELYQADLERRRDTSHAECIGEDAYCYIAHLYKMKNDSINECKWYIDGVSFFEKYRYRCKHTHSCYKKLASYYQKQGDLTSCISTYQKYIHYLLPDTDETCKLHRSIVTIIELSFEQMKDDDKRILNILKCLAQLVSKTASDLIHIDEEFQKIIVHYRINIKYLRLAAQMYESYVGLISTNVTLTLCVETIIPCFLEAAFQYQLNDNPTEAINIYRCLIEIMLKYIDDRERIVSIFRDIALTFEKKNNQIEMIMNVYEGLCTFVYKCPAQIVFKDNDLIVFIAERLQMLGKRFEKSTVLINKKIIEILRYYCETVNPQFDKMEYLTLIKYYYKQMAILEPTSIVDSYSNILELYLNYDVDNFETVLSEITSLFEDRSSEMREILVRINTHCTRLNIKIPDAVVS